MTRKKKSYGFVAVVAVVAVVVVVVSVVAAAAGVSVMVVAVVMVVEVSWTTAGASVVVVSVVVVVSSFFLQPVRSTVPNATASTRVRNFFISLSPSRLWRTLVAERLGICGKKASA